MSTSAILRFLTGLLPCLLAGLTLSHKAQAQVQISLSPTSATYTAGQSVTVTITGGTTGTNYSVNLYEGDPFNASMVTVYSNENSQGANSNAVTWADGQTSAVFYIRFGTGSVGANRVFEVADESFDDFADTAIPGFTVLPQPTLTLSLSPASTTYTVGQPIAATLTGGIVGETYSLLLYNGTPANNTDITNFMSVTSNQGNSDAIYWADGTTAGQFTLRFKSGAAGTNRTLEATSQPFLHLRDIPNLTIICPSVTVTATPSLTVASGGSVTLTASGATSYTWSNGVQSSSVVLTNVTSATTLSVTGVTGGCSATASAAVSVTAAADPCVFVPQNITVTGLASNLDGVFVPKNQEGYPSWGKIAFAYIDWNPNTNRWEIGDGDGTVFAYVSTNATSTNLPCTGWVASGGYGVPTLSGGCGSLTAGVAVSIAPSSQTITSGSSVTLTASGATSYTWSNGSTQNPLVLSNVTSVTTLSVTGTTGQCSATASVAVSVTQTGSPCTPSVPQNITITSTGSLLDGVYTPNGNRNGAPQWSKSGEMNYYLFWQGTTGTWEIWDDNEFIGRHHTGTINNLPCTGWDVGPDPAITLSGGCGALSGIPSVSIAPSSQTITSGGSVTLTASGATSYTWSNGSTQNPLVLSNVTSATTLSVTGTTGQCSATASAAVSVTAAPGPVINVGPLTGTATACLGTVSPEMTFTVSGTNLSTAPGNALNIIAPSGFEVLGLDGYADQIGLPIYGDGTVPPTTVSVRTTQTAPAGSLSGTITLSSSGATTRTLAVSATVSSVTAGITGNSPVTPGGSVTLTASGATTYLWSNGATTNPLVLTNVTSATTLSVTGTTGECSATTSAVISLACDPTIIADAVSITQTAVLGPDHCSVQLTGTGFGTGYTITGPDGYVFSAVYRKVGTYTINGLNVKQPGTYTFKVSYQNACGETSYDTMTYVVTGTACK